MSTGAAPSFEPKIAEVCATAAQADTRLPPLTVFLLAFLAAASFRFFLAIEIGPETYHSAVAVLAEGGWAERAAANILMLDGLSLALLSRF